MAMQPDDRAARVVNGTRIVGIASALPVAVEPVAAYEDRFGAEAVGKISSSTGVRSRHVAGTICTSDLCAAAAEQLLDGCSVQADTIDTIIFVTQTPDYVLPATACILQHRLGVPVSAAAFDVNLGCSGYVYGLWLAASLISGGGARRVLLLVGDTINRVVSSEDRSVALLFGDAGTATLLEADEQAEPLLFVLGTDGSGEKNLIVPHGGFRHRADNASFLKIERESGNKRSESDLYMNGAEIFSFTLARVPAMVSAVMKAAKASMDDVDGFVFHQANRFMMKHLAKRMSIPEEKLVVGLEHYGNTSSASIPLALCTEMAGRLRTSSSRLLLAGFGVGYSWAGCIASLDKLTIPEITYVQGPAI